MMSLLTNSLEKNNAWSNFEVINVLCQLPFTDLLSNGV